MIYNELKNEILNFKYKNKKIIYLNKRTRINNKLINSEYFKNTDLYKKIINSTNFLSENISIDLRLKCIFNDIVSIPTCPICNSLCTFIKTNNFKTVFTDTCGNKKCIATYAANYIKPQTEDIKIKHSICQTNYKKQIIINFNKLLEDYWKNNFEIIKKDILITFLNKNLINVNKNGPILKEKNFEIDKKYILNILYYTNFIDVPKNIFSKRDLVLTERIYCILNNINKLKVCPICNNKKLNFVSYKKGYSNTCRKCCGETIRNTIEYPSLNEIKAKINTDKYEIISFPKYTNTEQLIIKCKKCGEISKHWLYNGKGKNIEYMHLCSICDNEGTSLEEKELVDFIKSIYIKKIIENTKNIISPYELDIYIPEKKIAIEFDGLFWHSDINKSDKKYHLNKTELCEKQGIHLIHIFENEWVYKQEIVKSRIKNVLGIYDKTIFARKCEVKEISSIISNKFQYENHIQGYINSSINLGLFYENELISVMTFSKTRFSKKYEYELLRFCNKAGYHIPGAASKLLTYFERNYKPISLISYADRRWTVNNGNSVYNKLGFKLDHISNPDYWYFKNDKTQLLESRIKYQKHKLKNILEHFDETKTEYENMKDNGYLRIFDCGNLVYVKEY